jgi:Fic family protein
MDFGRVEYIVFETSNGSGVKKLKLTLIGQDDEEILRQEGLAGLRRRRIIRLTNEAEKQGSLLSYEDLAGLLLTSLATLKRDVNYLEKQGYVVPLKGRRKNASSNGSNGRRE